MKRFTVACFLLLSTFWVQAGPTTSTSSEIDIANAKAAIKALADALQTELKAAIQTGGPVAAIEVCNTRALPISQSVSADNGMQVSRVSIKNRSPLNEASTWQAAVLENFEAQKAAGKEVQSLSWTETVLTGNGKEFRFMKAIPTGGVCLACHGVALAPEISSKLAQLYPEDKATGFNEGDIRGAFVVTRLLSD